MESRDRAEVYGIYRTEFGGHCTFEQFGSYADDMERSGGYTTYVADDGGVIAGFITVVGVLSMVGPYLKINGLAVERSRQGNGVGSVLLERSKQHAREHGIEHIILCTGMQRERAHKFYMDRSFDMKSYCMTCSVNS